MHQIWLIATVESVAAIAIASFDVFQDRPTRPAVIARVSEPRSFVEVLTTQAAVAGAARRAASFERDAAARAKGRAEHYEVLAASEAVQGVDATVHNIGQRSAS